MREGQMTLRELKRKRGRVGQAKFLKQDQMAFCNKERSRT